MPASIIASAIAVPPYGFSTESMLNAFRGRLSRDLTASVENIGIGYRYSVMRDYPRFIADGAALQMESNVSLLCAQALTDALERAEIGADEIGLLIAVTNTQGRILPGLASELLALMPDLPRDMSTCNEQGQGCSALIKATELAEWYLCVHPDHKVAIVAGEVATPYIDRVVTPSPISFREAVQLAGDARVRATRSALNTARAFLFGDGAVALIVASGGGPITFGSVHHLTNQLATDVELLTLGGGGSAEPEVAGRPSYAMSAAVPGRGAEYALHTARALLANPRSQLASIDDASAVLIHTGSRKILDHICTALGVDVATGVADLSYAVLREYGNLSGASVGFMLERCTEIRGVGLVCTFGVGFSASAASVSFSSP